MAVNMHGICAKARIRDESPQNDPALKRQYRHSPNFRKAKDRCLFRIVCGDQ